MQTNRDMPKLAYMVLTNGIRFSEFGDPLEPGHEERVCERHRSVLDCHKFMASGVYRYAQSHDAPESLMWNDATCCPPYDAYWVEYVDGEISVGWLCLAEQVALTPDQSSQLQLRRDAKTIIHCDCVCGNNGEAWYTLSFPLFLDSEYGLATRQIRGVRRYDTTDEGARAFFEVQGIFLLYFHSLLACKNIEAVDAVEATPKQRKRVAKATKQAGNLQYKVLEVKLPGKRSYRVDAEPSGGKAAWHTVRRHPKRFGGNKGLLFGKYAGTYFWGPHSRGDKSRGTVVKDYDINERKDHGAGLLVGASTS